MTGVFAANELKQGIDSMVAGFHSLLASASDSQNVQAQLGAVLRSTGEAAGFSAGEINDLSASLQGVTAFSDEAIGSVQNVLLTFTQIKGDNFREAVGAILDLSTAMGQDLQSSAVQVGKALNDPVQGISALQRVGVSFSADQERVIQRMVQTGDAAGAQRMILQELAREFGGSAAAATDTFTGHMAQLRNELDATKEAVGGAFLSAFMELPKPLQELGLVVGTVLPTVAQMGIAIAALAPRFAALGVAQAASAGTATVNAAALTGEAAAAGAATVATTGLTAALLANPLTAVVLGVVLLGIALYELATHWDQVKEAANTFFNGLKSIAVDVINAVIDGINLMIQAWNLVPFHEKVEEVGHLSAGLRDSASAAREAAGAVDALSGALQSLPSDWQDMGGGVFANSLGNYYGATANDPAFANSFQQYYGGAGGGYGGGVPINPTTNIESQMTGGMVINGDVNVTQQAGQDLGQLLRAP